MVERSYFDWNATAPLRPQAAEALREALAVPGNPSSVHAEGRAARRLVGGGGGGAGAPGRRFLHFERHRSQHAGADAGDPDRGRAAAAGKAPDLGDRAFLGAYGRTVLA